MQDVECDSTQSSQRISMKFAYDCDLYGYQDAVYDRSEHVASLKADFEARNVDGLIDYLKEVIEDGNYIVPEATALLGRIEEIVPQKEATKEVEKAQEEVKEQHEHQEDENFILRMPK